MKLEKFKSRFSFKKSNLFHFGVKNPLQRPRRKILRNILPDGAQSHKRIRSRPRLGRGTNLNEMPRPLTLRRHDLAQHSRRHLRQTRVPLRRQQLAHFFISRPSVAVRLPLVPAINFRRLRRRAFHLLQPVRERQLDKIEPLVLREGHFEPSQFRSRPEGEYGILRVQSRFPIEHGPVDRRSIHHTEDERQFFRFSADEVSDGAPFGKGQRKSLEAFRAVNRMEQSRGCEVVARAPESEHGLYAF
mmetsp:Transcript_25207/g.30461  ORF Transcript_25207/g.30461 Transcript_25207/m.30461 type:complete len:245 (-) Transcript_25207:192-926(-)